VSREVSSEGCVPSDPAEAPSSAIERLGRRVNALAGQLRLTGLDRVSLDLERVSLELTDLARDERFGFARQGDRD
jgi:hypothetical protein